MDTGQFLDTLKREQTQLAVGSLTNPRGRDAFELGMLSGLIQAYARMQALLEEQLDVEHGKPRQSRPVRTENPYLAELDSAPTLPEQMGSRRYK